MDPKGKDIIISEDKRSLWHITIAVICYILGFYWICQPFAYGSSLTEIVFMIPDHIDLIIICFTLGLGFSTVTKIHFDLGRRRFKKEITLGSLGYGNWEWLPNLEYVSVFRKDEETFDVNVWHSGSKHFTIYTSCEMKSAYNMAYLIAIRLEIDMLDATVKNNSVWVRLDKEV